MLNYALSRPFDLQLVANTVVEQIRRYSVVAPHQHQ